MMAQYVSINGTQYPAKVFNRMFDKDWDSRESVSVTLEMTSAEALALFVDGVEWSVVNQKDGSSDDPVIADYSDYTLAGPVADNRDGTVTVKMGKIKDSEALAELLEALNG